MSELATLNDHIPMITSIIAIAISLIALGWTIYRDAIRKPKFRVEFAINRILHAGRGEEGPFLILEALNLGPIPNRITGTFLRKSWIRRNIFERKYDRAFVVPDFTHWATYKSGERIEVGNSARFVFPYDQNCFLSENYVRIGIADGFGRKHWAKRKDMRKVKEQFRAKFHS